MRDFDDNDLPLAYLITFRCYGSWLHGDERGAYRRNYRFTSGVARIGPIPALEIAENQQLKHNQILLTIGQRVVVEQAIRDVCKHRSHRLQAINVRTNHVHAVVSARCKPEPILNSFKAYATRELRSAGLLSIDVKPWSRHGSTVIFGRKRMWYKLSSTCWSDRMAGFRLVEL